MNNQPRGELVPGGLAMVIGGSNIGVLVEILARSEAGESVKCPDGVDRTRRCGVLGFLVTGPGFISEVYGGRWGFKKAHHLLPINPSADPLEINQQMEEKV